MLLSCELLPDTAAANGRSCALLTGLLSAPFSSPMPQAGDLLVPLCEVSNWRQRGTEW
jgi:hypothetical protein